MKKLIILPLLMAATLALPSPGQTFSPDNNAPRLIEFEATWCKYCRKAKPVIQRLQKKYRGRLEVVDVDVDDPANRTLMNEFGITMLPTFVFQKSSKEYYIVYGYNSDDELNQDAKAMLK